MLIKTAATPEYVLVEDGTYLPRYWATAWSISRSAARLASNTLRSDLQSIEKFYKYTDKNNHQGSLDDAISKRDAGRVQQFIEKFHFNDTTDPNYNTSTVKRWATIRRFSLWFARRMAVGNEDWTNLVGLLEVMGNLRKPKNAAFKFARALNSETLEDLLEIAEPTSDRNPFGNRHVALRNWLIVNLLLICGMRRGELLLLRVDSIGQGVDRRTGNIIYWLDIFDSNEPDERHSRPSIKTEASNRQIPIPTDLANLCEYYIAEIRLAEPDNNFLLTSARLKPLSSEAVNRILERLSRRLSDHAAELFTRRTGGKRQISPHDLRHTCATHRYSEFIRLDGDRDLALQRMRAYFGWSLESKMPDLYARSAIQSDLRAAWTETFDQSLLRIRRSVT